MAEVPIVAIATSDRPQGWMLINAADFDPQQHQVYGGLIHDPDSMGEDTAAGPLEETAPAGPLVQPSDGIGGHNLTQLRALASTEKIRGRSSMNEAELIKALQAKGYEL